MWSRAGLRRAGQQARQPCPPVRCFSTGHLKSRFADNVRVWVPEFDVADRTLPSKVMHPKVRTVNGSKACLALRQSGRVPGTIQVTKYADNKKNQRESFNLDFDHEEIFKEVSAGYFCNTLYQLEVEGRGPMVALPNSFVRIGKTEVVQNATFQEYYPGKRYKIELPIRTANMEDCEGIRMGGSLIFTQYTVPIWFEGGYSLPKAVVVDLDHVVPHSIVRMSQDVLPPGCTLRNSWKEHILLSMHAKGK